MKLNNKGYLIIEIVLASMIAFGVAYFLFDLTISLKDKSDNLQAKTIVMSDRTIVENYIMNVLNLNIEYGNPYCSRDKKKIQFLDDMREVNTIYLENSELFHTKGTEILYRKKINSKYANVSSLSCIDNGSSLEISMDLSMEYIDEDFNINLEYVY